MNTYGYVRRDHDVLIAETNYHGSCSQRFTWLIITVNRYVSTSRRTYRLYTIRREVENFEIRLMCHYAAKWWRERHNDASLLFRSWQLIYAAYMHDIYVLRVDT